MTVLTLPADSPGSFWQEVISPADELVSLLCLFHGFSLIFFHGYWPVQVSYFDINADVSYFSKESIL